MCRQGNRCYIGNCLVLLSGVSRQCKGSRAGQWKYTGHTSHILWGSGHRYRDIGAGEAPHTLRPVRRPNGRRFRPYPVWQERGRYSAHGQHDEDHDLYFGAGIRQSGRNRGGFLLCNNHAEGETVCQAGRKVHTERSPLFAYAGIPQWFRGGDCGSGGGKRGRLCFYDEPEGEGHRMLRHLFHHA